LQKGPHGFAIRAFACSPQYSSALSTLPKNCWRDEPNSAARRHEASGSRRAIRPARTSRARRCRVHRNPAHVSNDRRTAPLPWAGLFRLMPQFRISVKWNILRRRVDGRGVFCPTGERARKVDGGCRMGRAKRNPSRSLGSDGDDGFRYAPPIIQTPSSPFTELGAILVLRQVTGPVSRVNAELNVAME
jgi:hypothetical protein